MPTYDYVCTTCRHELEIFHSINDSPKRKCPECGRLTLKRQIGSGGGIIFKGSGFYETDYRSAEYQKSAKADEETSRSPDSKTSESKTSESKTSESKTAESKTADSEGGGSSRKTTASKKSTKSDS